MPRPVSIIILCHNDQLCLRNCADSIERHTKPGACELIIVDNGSARGAARELAEIRNRSKFPVRIIRNKRNRFFGPANNQGLAAVKHPFVLFLNADTIVTPGWLPSMLSAMNSDPRLAIVGPMTNSAVGLQMVNNSCSEPRELRRWFARWKNGRFAEVRIVPWIIGFCVLMPREIAVRLGGFDELYGPGGYEDYDLCLKARLAGYEIAIASRAYVHHLGGRGYSGMDYDEMRKSNREIYRAKWCGLVRRCLKSAI
jgi:GT2 family glycosyltransferase